MSAGVGFGILISLPATVLALPFWTDGACPRLINATKNNGIESVIRLTKYVVPVCIGVSIGICAGVLMGHFDRRAEIETERQKNVALAEVKSKEDLNHAKHEAVMRIRYSNLSADQKLLTETSINNESRVSGVDKILTDVNLGNK